MNKKIIVDTFTRMQQITSGVIIRKKNNILFNERVFGWLENKTGIMLVRIVKGMALLKMMATIPFVSRLPMKESTIKN